MTMSGGRQVGEAFKRPASRCGWYRVVLSVAAAPYPVIARRNAQTLSQPTHYYLISSTIKNYTGCFKKFKIPARIKTSKMNWITHLRM